MQSAYKDEILSLERTNLKFIRRYRWASLSEIRSSKFNNEF